MVEKNLEAALQSADNPAELLRKNRGRHPYPVASEHTNWIEEVRSWRETCSLSDLSHHQKDLYVEGPEALDVFEDLGVNDFDGFGPGQAKQFVACNPNGNLIGDAILFYLGENELKLTGTPVAPNWVEYNLERGDYDATVHADERYHDKDEPHDTFRYQLQGPNALDVMRDAVEGEIPDIPFFNFDEMTIAGVDVRALKHSMASNVGFEIWGPWEEHETVRDALVGAGEPHGLRELGEKSYKAQGAEKGWIARPLPAIFGEGMREYREWLDADGYEAISTLGGSFDPDDISEYYLNPIELGYERFIDFDHDFVGREALSSMVEEPQRRKVTLVWDDADVLELFASLLREGETYKYFDLSMPYWAVFHYDEVLKDGENAGVSKYFGYTYNERSVLSLAVVEPEYADPGTEVTLVWGEPGGDSENPKVEPHVQTEITATVAPNPYVDASR
ncbi:aminomethyltransferase family protein [Halobellus captivus]|uniref:aminomethyltransferase family protein n=1 Tax=Halobellus captivus TaxID=2592614 RepID=UPI0011A2A3A3|nr:aminomethyltransferase family protein [Halobellus captivus]